MVIARNLRVAADGTGRGHRAPRTGVLTALGLPRARLQLRRATRQGGARPADALPLALASCDLFRDVVARDPRRCAEYAAGLLVVADLQLALVDLPAALTALDALVALRDHGGAPGRDVAGDDRLAEALTRRGHTHRLLAEFDRARTDLDRAGRCAQGPLVRVGVQHAAGVLAKDTGEYERADRCHRRAMDLVVGLGGPDHPDLAAGFHHLADLELARRRYETGEAHARRAVGLRLRQHGPDSVQVAADLTVLGALLAGQHRLSEAEPILEQVLATWTNRRGPDHYEVAVATRHLAAVHAGRGLLSRAAQEYRAALAIKRRVLGYSHPEVVALTMELAHTLDAASAWPSKGSRPVRGGGTSRSPG